MTTVERLLYVVRHGATDWNAAGRIQGHLDPPLNAAGRAQAWRTAQHLAAVGATALYSSDLQRAYETAQIIAQHTGLRVIQSVALREMHFGAWQGLTVEEIRARDPEVYAARRANPYEVPPPGGESWRQFYTRVVRAVEEILHRTPAPRLILVTHSGVCTVLGLHAQGLGYRGKRNFGNTNCAIHTFAVSAAGWRVVNLHAVAHLAEVKA
ncbi:MAG: phosphoglycerate mutase [Candidatus Tectimicrobiota bacterium]|nr:MAG: phosphoglycerate mutase [Candidatus Tectomicrobia bacterium]